MYKKKDFHRSLWLFTAMAVSLNHYPRMSNKETFKRLLNGDTLLLGAVTLGYLAMGLGTSPVSITGGLIIFILIVSGKWLRCDQLVRQHWFWPILFMIFLNWIGLFYTPDPGGSGLKFALKTHYWLVCVAVALWAFEKYDFKWLVWAFFGGLGLSAVVGWLQFTGIAPPKNGQFYTGFGSQYSTINVFLIVAMLTASDLFRRSENWQQRTAYLVLLLLFFSHLVIMRGRSGYVTLLIVSPLIARNLMGGFSTARVLIVCLLLPPIMYLSPVVRQRVDRTVDELHFHITTDPRKAWGKIYTHYQDRFFMWQYAGRMIQQHPLIGVGTGGFKPTVTQMDPSNTLELDHPHNDLFFLTVSFGLFGVLAYFWFYGTLFASGWRHCRQLPARFIFYVALTMVLSGMLNGHMLDAGTAFLLAMAAGLQPGLSRVNTSINPQDELAQ